MLIQKVEDSLNSQIVVEGFSSNLYLAMASWAGTEGFRGIAEWLYAQSEEERLHMLKFIHYVNDRGGKAVIPAFSQPPLAFDHVRQLFTEVLKHEQKVSANIFDIVAVCIAERDFSTQNWLQWFVNEQQEEEKNAQAILDKLKLIGNESLYLFDRDIMSMRAGSKTDESIG